MNVEEMLAHDPQPAFGQQEVDVGHAPVLRILDGDDRLSGAPFTHGIERVLERKARQGQPLGHDFQRGAVRIGPRRALKRNRAGRIGSGGGAHAVDEQAGGFGEILHGQGR
jgi:hypothetical protein